MEATIRINTNQLNPDFLEGIRKMFPDQEVAINIHSIDEIDETDFILSRPAYAAELTRRIEEYERTKKTITVDPSALL